MMGEPIRNLYRLQYYNEATIPARQPTRRKASYIQIAREDLHCLDLYKPAQHFRTNHNQLPFLRRKTQSTSYIPSYLHLNNNHTCTPYDEGYCLPVRRITNEAHTLLHCLHSSQLSQTAMQSFTLKLRRFDLCAWTTCTDIQNVVMLLGSTPPKLDRKHEKAWALLATPTCTLLIRSIQSNCELAQPRLG